MAQLACLTIAWLLPAWDAGAVTPARWDTPILFARNSAAADGSKQYLAINSEARVYFSRGRVAFRMGKLPFELHFLGADGRAEPRGDDPQPGVVNYLTGNRPEQWSSGLETYGGLTYHGIYPGVDVRFGFSGRRLKSEFTIAAGADPRRIRFEYSGLGPPHLNARGDVTFQPQEGQFREEAPIAFQWKQGIRVDVPARFVLAGQGGISFELGAFDPTIALIIDPVVTYSTYLGGQGDTAATAIAADSSGNVYVTGWTDSVDFPTANPEQSVLGGSVDAFVLKLSPGGNTLLYATYIGGSGDDRGFGIAVDDGGNAYVTGFTTSTNFPTSGPIQATLRGTRDAFVLKLSPSGDTLVFSTCVGGTGAENGNAIAVDAQGNAYITGDTTSTDFPLLGPLQTVNNGRHDAFVTKMDSTGVLLYSTYLGGHGDDRGAAIAVDASGNAYVTGGTFSTDFPAVGPFQAANAGGQDAFVSKLSPAGSSLLYSTYLGGSGGAVGSPETGSGIAVDSVGSAYVAGSTSSSNFPVVSALQPIFGGGTSNAFLVKLSPAGSSLVYSTYFGGSGADYGNAIALDSAGKVYAAGYTASADLPVAAPIDGVLSLGYDAFVLQLNATGNVLNFATYYGGSGTDAANGIALDSSGNAYVAGQTLSTDFAVVNPIQSTMLGSIEGFVLELTFGSAPDYSVGVAPGSRTAVIGGSTTYTVTVTGSNGFSGTVSLDVSGLPAGVTGSFNPASIPGSGSSTLTINASAGAAANDYTITVTGTSGSLIHSNTATLTIIAGGSPNSVSVTPSSGTGLSQTFAFLYSDPNGAADIVSVQMDISAALSTTNACYLFFVASSNTLFLADDSGSFQGPLTIGTAGTLSNSQCSVSSGASSVSSSGNNLTLNLALTFASAFTGAKNVFMEVRDGAVDSGWSQQGAWTVVAAPPPPDFSIGMAPGSQSAAAGGSTSYTVTVTSNNGFNATVNLSVSGLPSGVTGTFNPTSITGSGTSTLTVNANSGAAASNSTLTVSGASGSLIHSASATLTITTTTTGGAPTPVSVTPGSGTGLSQTFAFLYSDPNGAADISSAQMDIHTTLSAINACYLFYVRSSNALFLANDAGSFQGPLTIGVAGTLSNSQCSVSSGASSVASSGNNLTLNLALTFASAFAGGQNIFMEVRNASLDSGWSQKGTWTVASGPPPPDFSLGVAPGSRTVATGSSTIFTVTIAANNGFSGTVNLAVSGLPSGVTGTFNPTSITGSGASTLTINAGTGAATGNAIITTTGASASLSHSALSTLIVKSSGAGPLSTVSVTPASGSGFTQTFAFLYSDSNGASDIKSVQMDISAALSATNACYLFYVRSANSIYLANDAGVWQGPAIAGVPGTLQNTQCSVNAGATTVLPSGNTLTVNFPLTFKSPFVGAKNVFMEVRNATLDSGWNHVGTWTVGTSGGASPSPPAQVSVAPSTGSGSSQTFAFTFADLGGAANIVSAQMEINPALAVGNACYLFYLHASNAIYLANDAGTWQGPLTLGVPGTLQNSQCSLDGAGSSAVSSGNNLTVNAALTFNPAFAGAKNIYMEARNPTLDSGWVSKGAWTVH